MAFENFSSVNNFNVKPVQQTNRPEQHEQHEISANPKPDESNHKILYATLGALAVIGTAGTVIYRLRKGQGIKPQSGGGKPPVCHETPPVRINGTATEAVRHIIPEKFSDNIAEQTIGAKKFYSLKEGEIPQGYHTSTEMGDNIAYAYDNGIAIYTSKTPEGLKEAVLVHNEKQVGKICFDSTTGNISKSTFPDTAASDLEVCYTYNKNGKFQSYQEIKTTMGRVRTTTTNADGTKSIIEKDTATNKTTLEEYYDKDGRILSCKMDGEDVVIGDDISSGDYSFKIEKPTADTGVTFRNGLAIGNDGKIYTGVLERTSKNGNKVVTTYHQGRVTERIYYPANGQVKQIHTHYTDNGQVEQVRSYITKKDGTVSHKYYVKISERPIYELKGLFSMSEFNNLKFNEILGKPHNITEKNGKKIVSYPNDINIVYETRGNKQHITLRKHKTELRKLTFYNNGIKDIWIDSHTSIGIKNGEFYHYKKITDTKEGGYISERTFADGTGEKVTKDSNNTTVSTVKYDAYGQTV